MAVNNVAYQELLTLNNNRKNIFTILKKVFFYIFFIKRNNAKLKNHIISSLLMALVVFLPDLMLSFSGRANINIHVIITAIAILLCFLTSFGGLVLKMLFGLFIFIAQFSQLNYAFVTGFALDPLLVSKIFQDDTKDFVDNIGAVWHVDLIYFAIFVLFVIFNIKYRKAFHFSFFSLFAVLASIGWLFHNAYNKDFGKVFVSPTRQTIRNSLPSYAFFLTHIKTINKLDDSLIEKAYKKYEVKKVSTNTPRVIVIFMGESTNARDMSLINKNVRKTTPLLEKFAEDNDEHFMYMTAMSGAVATIASHALFFNTIREPGNVKCLKNLDHNLFKMAKDNGYKTHWLSTQSIINPDYASVFADDLQTQESNALIYARKRDDLLVDEFKKMDLSQGKHLVVINPRTAHIPFHKNYEHRKKEFKVYKDNKTRLQQEISAYHNSIVYLDWILNELLSVAVRKDVDYFFITSDHGEMIKEDGGWHGFGLGHNILDIGITYVPFIVYSKDKNKAMFDDFKSKKLITHYEISKFIAKLLGYEVKNPNEVDGEFFIHESRITGDYRVLPYKIENGEARSEKVISVQEYMKSLAGEQAENDSKKVLKDGKNKKSKNDKDDAKNNGVKRQEGVVDSKKTAKTKQVVSKKVQKVQKKDR